MKMFTHLREKLNYQAVLISLVRGELVPKQDGNGEKIPTKAVTRTINTHRRDIDYQRWISVSLHLQTGLKLKL